MELIYLPHYKENKDKGLDAIDPIVVKDIDDAGVDLRAAIEEPITLGPGEEALIPSGIKMFIGSHPSHGMIVDTEMGWSTGIYGCVLPRSGLGFKHYVRLANTAGVIDAGYQNEIMIKLRNESVDSTLTIERGDRICQMVFHMYIRGVNFITVDEFSDGSTRGEKGFGDSGVK
ncbi:dUTPase [Vibrio phage D479]